MTRARSAASTTTEPDPLAHLGKSARQQLDLPDAERMRIIKAGTWLELDHARYVLDKMEELLEHPIVTRMPNILLVGPSFSGKTSIIERFMQLHPPDLDPAGEATLCPVVQVEAPYKPDITDFFSRILHTLMSPYKPNAPTHEKYPQIKLLFQKMGVRMLIVDEIHHLIAGSLNRQREFRNALKSLGNETKVCIVAAGTEEAYNAFAADPQMSSRFVPYVLPKWSAGQDMGILLASLEGRMPLKKASNLASVEMMLEIDRRAEGPLGDVCDLVRTAGVEAIRSGTEQITLPLLQRLDWVPPSKRKAYPR